MAIGLYKRNKIYWMDATVNGQRYREPLGTSDWKEARARRNDRIAELKNGAPMKLNKAFASMTIAEAIDAYVEERRASVSPRMLNYWKEQARPLSRFYKDLKLKRLAPQDLNRYQNARLDDGKAPKTINGEVSVLRQLLKHAKLWYRLKEDYKPIKNTKPPVGRALTDDEQERLFFVAESRSDWMYAHAAATLGIYCGLRACEIKALTWKDIDLTVGTLDVRRSKTPAGWRTPTLNEVCKAVLARLRTNAALLSAVNPEHYVFPWHGREQKIDPTKPITSWRSAWRSIRKAAGLSDVRFHDLRHSAITTLAEKGTPDWIIMAQVGHVSPAMLKTYSHIRRQALNQAAASLEPSFRTKQSETNAELIN